jgi:hypothetical protein
MTTAPATSAFTLALWHQVPPDHNATDYCTCMGRFLEVNFITSKHLQLPRTFNQPKYTSFPVKCYYYMGN